MFVNEKYPYATLFAGLVFLTLPFALAVHDAFACAFGRAGCWCRCRTADSAGVAVGTALFGLCSVCLRF
ncbi:TPA: 2-oxoglutarate translocator [Neisseria gonorrhoeae]